MRVLVSGAGVAGPTVAYFLAKAGFHVVVAEKTPRLLPYGQSIDIHGSAVAVAKKMGVLREIRRHNTTEVGSRFVDETGRAFALFPSERNALSPTSEFEILRGDLAKVLHSATKGNPRVEYLFGTTIDQVLSNDERSVKVKLSNGQVHEFDLLIAADGQWSRIRKWCFASDSVTIVDKNMYGVYWTLPRMPSDKDWWTIYPTLRSRFVSLRPDPHGTVRATLAMMPLNCTQKDAWEAASRASKSAQVKLVKSEFGDAGWQTQRFLDAMNKTDDFYFHSISQVRMVKWSQDRVVCLGDAAYAPTPLTGAGTSLAMVGAYVLAGELSTLADGQHPKEALDAYDIKFRPHVEAEQKIPPYFPGLIFPQGPWGIWLLQWGIWAVAKVLPIISPILRATINIDQNEFEDFPLPLYPVFDGPEAAEVSAIAAQKGKAIRKRV